MERRPTLDFVLRTHEGRFRLGWRLTFFVLGAASFGLVLGLLLPAGLLTGSIALLCGSVAAGVLLLELDRRPAGSLGFYLRPRAVKEAASGLLLGLVVALAVVACLFLTGGVRWSAQEGSALEWVMGALGALAFLALPAAAEEALLRGYPLQALAEAWGPAAALGVTSLVFGALHLSNPGISGIAVLNVVAAGVFLGVIYLRTASLWWATGAHLGWNWAHGYLADVPVSGLELMDAPFYDGVMQGPAWLGGGGFGPEGSVVSTLLIGAAVVWCWRTKWLRASEAALAVRPLIVKGTGET